MTGSRCLMTRVMAVVLFAAFTHQVKLAIAQEGKIVPYVPTPQEVVDRMLELAEVKKGDVLYDLGSGDGRIIIRAAKKYGARGIGIEMDRTLIDKARKSAQAEGVSHLVEFRVEDALKTDISPATVVTLYMLPWFNEAMKPNFQKYLTVSYTHLTLPTSDLV